MVKRIALATAFALLGVVGTAWADPIALDTSDGLVFKFSNIELVQPCTGDTEDTCANNLVIPGDDGYYSSFEQGNWGLVIIDTISFATITDQNELLDVDQTRPALFSNMADGTQVVGIFYDIQLTSQTTAEFGFLDLFWWDTNPGGDGDPLGLAGTDPAIAATFSDFFAGTFLARISFVPGILGPADCDTTILSNTAVTPTSASGFADSFGDVVVADGGEWAEALDGNWFTNTCSGFSDIKFKNSFELINSGPWAAQNAIGILGLDSDDPAQAINQQAVVPEPATLTLLGLGLAGLAARRRRLL